MTEQGPGISVGAMARRLGVAPATLRTWDLRYGISPSRRSEGGHRRYDPTDVARLEVMHRLILNGVSPGEAARTALSVGPEPSVPATRDHAAAETQGHAEDRASGRGHGGGGNRLRLGTADPAARGLARAAMALDATAIRAAIDTAIAARGVIGAWEGLIVPVLVAIGERHAQTGACVEIEHLVSGVIMNRLTAVPRRADPLNARPVLLACAPEEQHSLPLCALEAALAEAGVGALALGARVPERALSDAVRRTGPPAIVVWSQTRATGDPEPISRLPRLRPAARVMVGGPGWAYDRLPGNVRRLSSLAEATAELLALLHLA